MSVTATTTMSELEDTLRRTEADLRALAHRIYQDALGLGLVDTDNPEADGNGLTGPEAVAYHEATAVATAATNALLRLSALD